MRRYRGTIAALAVTLVPLSAAGEPDRTLYDNLPALDMPAVDADVLAMGHSFRIVGGGVDLTATSRDIDGDGDGDNSAEYALTVDTRYFRSLEKRTFGYSVVLQAGDDSSRTPIPDGVQYRNAGTLELEPEVRLYLGHSERYFLYGAGQFDMELQTTKTTGEFPVDADSLATGQVGAAMGVGYGRVIAVDPVIRLRRLQHALQGEGLLAGEIPQAVGNDIIRSWYALRNHVGGYPRLAYTMKHLADAGLLRGEPNLRATYEAIAILQDPFIFDRMRGSQMRIGLGLIQPFIGLEDGADDPDAQVAILGSAQLERPLATDRQLSVRGQLFVDVGDVETADRRWSVRGYVTHTQAFYSPSYDPLGSLTLAAELGVSGLRSDDPDSPVKSGIEVRGSAAYSRVLNGGSLASFGGNLSVRNDGSLVLGLNLGISWGLAAGFYTPYAAPSAAPAAAE